MHLSQLQVTCSNHATHKDTANILLPRNLFVNFCNVVEMGRSALTSKRFCFILANNIWPNVQSLPKPSASAEC